MEEKVVTEAEAEKNEPQERVVNHKKIVITEISDYPGIWWSAIMWPRTEAYFLVE